MNSLRQCADQEGYLSMNHRRNDDLTTVATTSMLQEADVICSVLKCAGIDAIIIGGNTANTLSYLEFAINPHGIRVAVNPENAQAARDILAENFACQTQPQEASPAPAPQKAQPSPEECIAKAVRSAFFVLWLPPLIVGVIYWLIISLRARQSVSVQDPARYRRSVTMAISIGLVIPLAVLAIVLIGIFNF